MNNTFLKLVVFLFALFTSIVTQALETKIYSTDFSNLQALSNGSAPATVSADGNYEIIKGDITISGGSVAWAPSNTSYFMTSSSTGQFTLNNLDLNSGGRIVIKWGTGSSRALFVSSGKTFNSSSPDIGTHPTLASGDRSKIITDDFTIPSSLDGMTSITINSSGGGSVYIFSIEVYTNAAGPNIETFTLAGASGTVTSSDATTGAISVTVPYSTNLSSLLPVITLTSGTSYVTPADETTPKDFTGAATYAVTDGITTKTYTVTVSKVPPSTAKAITAFNLSGYTGAINEGAKTISIVVPYSSAFPITATPTVTVSSLASLQTTGDQTFNEGVPVNFSVQAEDGSTQIYQATVTKAPASTACNINSFSTGYATETVIIDQIAKTISVTVSSTNDITNLSPIVGNSALSSIASPAFPTDFTNPVSITVLAEDGVTSKTYTVTTVKDGTSPILTSSTPSDTQTAVSLAGIITLNYDEDVVLGSGTISISGGSLGTPVIVGNKVKIPFSGLTSLTAYSITVPAGLFTDKFGNQAASSTINFTTADGENHSTWYASYMDAENFAIPAFISPASAYIDSIDVKAASINQYGAYKLSPGDTLTITTDSVGYASIIAYSLAANRTVTISNSANASVSSYTFYEYENRGATLSQLIDVANETTPTKIYIVNTSVSGDIFIPYISLSEVGSAAPLDEKTVFCK